MMLERLQKQCAMAVGEPFYYQKGLLPLSSLISLLVSCSGTSQRLFLLQVRTSTHYNDSLLQKTLQSAIATSLNGFCTSRNIIMLRVFCFHQHKMELILYFITLGGSQMS